ncbi:MAG: LEA type 2 family protein [Gemmatimonadales bacterium]|nr:LEA type 2 family protein [Gemmatimonadales bacterium]
MKARLALLALPLAATLACSGIPKNFRDPEFQLSQVVVRGVGLTGGTMDLIVNVRNPNDFDLRGTRLQVGFDVENSHVGDIEYKDEFQVRKNDVATLTLPVRFNWSGVGTAVRAAIGYGDIPYKMRGQAIMRTPWGDRSIPFTREGRAPLTRTQSEPGATSLPPSPSR